MAFGIAIVATVLVIGLRWSQGGNGDLDKTASGGSVILDVRGMGMEGYLLRQLTAEFEKRYPQVTVRVQAIPWGAGHEKLMTAIVGDMTPDVAQIGTTWMAELIALNALEPLDPCLASSPIREDDFFPGTLGTNRIGGVWYGPPFYVDTRLLFYRADLVASAGFARFPETWQEFDVLCDRLQVFSEPYMLTGGGSVDSTVTLVLYMYTHGFRFFRVGYASAVAMTLFLCSLVLLMVRSHLRREMPGGRPS